MRPKNVRTIERMVSEDTGVSMQVAHVVIRSTFQSIMKILVDEPSVQIFFFGTFYKTYLRPCQHYNLETKEVYTTKPIYKIKFKPWPSFSDAVNRCLREDEEPGIETDDDSEDDPEDNLQDT